MLPLQRSADGLTRTSYSVKYLILPNGYPHFIRLSAILPSQGAANGPTRKSRTAPPPGRWSWNCGMMRWRRSTREGTIYRTKWARVNLTYHFAVSVKSEGTQEDMVTVRTVIKGLWRWFDRKRSWSGDILLCEISWSVRWQRLVTVILPIGG